MRIWTPKMVDDLIDDAEKEAEEMAKAQKETDAAKLAEQEEEEDPSKRGGFSFAKIWETKAKEATTGEGDNAAEEPAVDFDEHGWVQFLEQAEATEEAQRQAARAVAGRLRALKKNVKYNVDIEDPFMLTGRKGKDKHLSQATVDREITGADRDDDFIPADDDVPSDDDDLPANDGPIDLEDLSNEQRTIIGGIAAGKRKLTKYERALLRKWHSLDEKKRAEALQSAQDTNAAVQVARDAVPNQAEAGPGPATMHHQASMQQRAMADGIVVPYLSGGAVPQRSALVAAAAAHVASIGQNGTPPRAGEDIRWPVVKVVPEPLHTRNVSVARGLLLELFKALQRLQNPDLLQTWRKVVTPSVAPDTRKRFYVHLGSLVDGHRRRAGIAESRWLVNERLRAVFYFIDSRADIRPPKEQTAGSGGTAPAPRPPQEPLHAPAPIPAPPQLHGPPSHSVAGPSSHQPFRGQYQAAPQPMFQSQPYPPYNPPVVQPMGYHTPNTVAGFPYGPPHYNGQPIITQAPLMQQPGFQDPQQFSHQHPQTPPRQDPQMRMSNLLQRVSPRTRARTQVSGRSHDPPAEQGGFASKSASSANPVNASRANSAASVPNGSHSGHSPAAPVQATRAADPTVAKGGSSTPNRSIATSAANSTKGSPATADANTRNGSRSTTAPPSTVISISNGPGKDTGAKPVDTPSAIQLGDSSRFDPQSYREQGEGGEEECYWCQQNHVLRDCPGLIPLDQIETYRRGIQADAEAPEESKVGSALPSTGAVTDNSTGSWPASACVNGSSAC